MTSLLLHWLNDELALHRKVAVLERDLCNAYILAEVLHVHGLENRLDRYSDANDLPTRVANLELLDKAMVAAGLGELSTATKREILMETRSAILQLLLRVKEFLESRGKKLSLEQQKLKSVTSRVYEPRSPAKDPARTVQDVEARFVRETAKRLQPKQVRFYKDVNSAVHLRKFPQAQWRAENELIEYEETRKAAHANRSANSMAALRAHLHDKRVFINDWDAQRLEKWRQTQERYLAAERDDLRLERTLEERQRRFRAAKLAETQATATSGVVGFERNMSRLGLADNSSAVGLPLRAIPATDAGPAAHFQRLETRVDELGFRPSNNVQMMKELRARRKAQLAAEKDRRMRRMRPISDSLNSRAKEEEEEEEEEEENESTVGQDQPDGVAGGREDSTATAEDEQTRPALSLQEAFIAANREALEANYERLREQGELRRDLDAEELQRLRLEKRGKTLQRNTQDCADIVGELLALAIASIEQDVAADTATEAEWRRETWFDMLRAQAATGATTTARSDSLGDVSALTASFLELSNVWEPFADRDGATAALGDRVESFVRSVLSTSPDELLDTKRWPRLEDARLVTVYTSDERAAHVARQAAADQGLHYVNVDELVEECLKSSYDPVKQAELAASMAPRERELGVFGPKLAPLRQKNAPIPESLAVEIVMAAVSVSREVQQTSSPDGESDGESPSSEDASVGCLLHNFPRTLDEWKLFERAMVNSSETDAEDDATAQRLASLDAALAGETGTYSSSISCAMVVSCWEQPQRAPSPVTPERVATPELTSSAAERRRPTAVTQATENSKRQLVDPLVAKAEAETKALHERQLVEEVLSRTSWLVKIDQEEMHTRVLQELIHLSIDVYSRESSRERVGVAVQCPSSASSLPSELDAARQQRRSSMPLATRVAWLIASRELQLDEPVLVGVVVRLRQLDQVQTSNLSKLFHAAQRVLADITSSTQLLLMDVDARLGSSATECAQVVERAARGLRNTATATDVDRLLIAAEVALGDIVDQQRIAANAVVDENQAETPPPSARHVARWLQLIPRVCLEAKEYAVDAMRLLRAELYSTFPFLRASSGLLPVRVAASHPVLSALDDAVDALEQSCRSCGLQIRLRAEIDRLVGQVVVRIDSEGVAEPRAEPAYELHEDLISLELATAALRRTTAVLRWSTALLDCLTSLQMSDVDTARHYINQDLRASNVSIARVMRELGETGRASWPEDPGTFSALTASPRPRHERAAFLSVAQVVALVDAFREAERTLSGSGGSRPRGWLRQDKFVATVVDAARRHGFADAWQHSTGVARVAMAWSSDVHDWRQFVFTLVCDQAVGTPTVECLEAAVEQLRRVTQSSADSARVHRADFVSRVRLWWEKNTANDGAWKPLLFSLFTTESRADEAEILPMLLTWCGASAHPRGVRGELASALLPRYARGLHRAFTVLSRWHATIGGSSAVHGTQLRPLLAFVGVGEDAARLETAQRLSWGPQCGGDFLAWCDAYDAAIAQRFVVHDTLATLVRGD